MGVFGALFPEWLASLNITSGWLSASVSALVACATALLIACGVFLTRDDRLVLRARLLALIFKTPDAEAVASAQ